MKASSGKQLPILMVLVIGIGFVGILIFGSWTARIIAAAAVFSFCACAYWFDWWIRFRPGDRVQVKSGPHQGSRGVVIEPLREGSGARVELELGDRTETVDFLARYELKKI
jgi:membrane protein implicated in regulation of membrane protease activity